MTHSRDSLETFATRTRGRALAFLLASLAAQTASAQAPESRLLAQNSRSLAELSLEELMSIPISSVSRREQELSGAAASIFVITADDIRRSGATSLPEVLRLAPNLQVARRNTYEYAITARGFNNSVGNKLLVLMDGRTLYTPLFSGVFWEMQDTVLEDIERIEVISGPGATLWGANAVNGVINIITRHSADTLGSLMVAEAGNYERGVSFRRGASAGENLTWRAWGKARKWDNTLRANRTELPDDWESQQIGFRADWQGEGQQLSLQGDVMQGETSHRGVVAGIGIPAVEVLQGNLLADWTRELRAGSSLRVQGYLSHGERDEFVLFSPDSDIFDLNFQHNFSQGAHQVVWGGGVRHARDQVGPGFYNAFIPNRRSLNWENLFVQDDVDLADSLRLTLGLKLEWNDYTGMEYLPTARLAWRVSDEHTFWSSLTRAVRAPSRFDRDVFVPRQPPFIIAGGPDFISEMAKVAELGYRGQPAERFNYALTLYYHDWEKLRSGTPLPLPTYLANGIEGEVYGVESWANLQLASWWRIRAGFTALEKNLAFRPGSGDTVGVNNATLHNDPDYQWRLRSSLDLPGDLMLDLQLRRVDDLEVEPVPSYTELDLWLGWQAADNLELSLSGRNLLDSSHPEFEARANRAEIPRSFLFGIEWTFDQ